MIMVTILNTTKIHFMFNIHNEFFGIDKHIDVNTFLRADAMTCSPQKILTMETS